MIRNNPIGIIESISIFMAVWAALSTAFLFYKINIPALDKLKRIAGSAMLFITIIFSLTLLLLGYLFRIFLLKVIIPLLVFDAMATIALLFIWLSRLKNQRWQQFLKPFSTFKIVVILLISFVSTSLLLALLWLILNS